jgi:hypothetical protein
MQGLRGRNRNLDRIKAAMEQSAIPHFANSRSGGIGHRALQFLLYAIRNPFATLERAKRSAIA